MNRLKRNLVSLLQAIEAGNERKVAQAYRLVTQGCPWDLDEVLEARIDIECDHGGWDCGTREGRFEEVLEFAKRKLEKVPHCGSYGCQGPRPLIVAQGITWECWGNQDEAE